MPKKNRSLPRRSLLAALVAMIFLLPMYGAQEPGAVQSPGLSAEERLEADLAIAHAQHDIIRLYIKDNQFDKIWPAAQVLLSLRFPPDLEVNTVKSLAIISEELSKKQHGDLAHQILEAASRSLSAN